MICSYLLHGYDVIRILKLCIEERSEAEKGVPLKREFPLLIVPTPERWKAEYTLANRMQIYESVTVLALLTSGEARTGDSYICSLMLYHLSYLTTTHIHMYIHTYIVSIKRDTWLVPILSL